MLEAIKMTKPKSCSVCCIAMLTKNTFDDAVKLCFPQYPKDFSMNFDAMKNALINAGLKIKCSDTTPNVITEDTLIECKHKTEHYWHYIVYDAEQNLFIDPIPNPPKVEDYEFFRSIAIQK